MKKFRISSDYFNTDWISLVDTEENISDWHRAVAIVKDRFYGRLVNHLISLKENGRSGFVMMAIMCLTIEMLMQFYLGIESTSDHERYNRKGFDSGMKKDQSRVFVDFFMNSSHFKDDFDSVEKCIIFYSHFRNGLLHQAQTKNKSKIKIKRNSLIDVVDNMNLSEGLILDRNIFLERMELEISDYLELLLADGNNFIGEKLRKNCIHKMRAICEV